MAQDLKHFGVMGMKWGKRKAAAKAWVKEGVKVTANSIAHPFLTDKANEPPIKPRPTTDTTNAINLFLFRLYSNFKKFKPT